LCVRIGLSRYGGAAMEISQSYWLTLAIALGYEYGIKQWWERLGSNSTHTVRGYVLFRFIHLALLCVTGFLLFSDMRFATWVAFSIGLVILGSLELLLRFFIDRIQGATHLSFYQLNYLIPLLIALYGRFISYTPRLDLDYRLVFLLIFLAHPANCFIRWALHKDEPAPVSESKSLSEAAATSTDGRGDPELDDQRAKVGRRIGTLERWLIVFLIASGNVAGVGLVITAKSIVRYPQLGNRAFAEYYLFGTLLSVVLALASSFVVLGGL